VIGVLGLVSLVLVFTPLIANAGPEPEFVAPTPAVVRYIRSLGAGAAPLGSFVTVLGIVLWLVFAVAVLWLLRERGGSSWRLPAAGAAAIVFVAVTVRADETAAALRPDTGPAIARYAFDEGSLSFANGWVALGVFAALAGWDALAARSLPRWLGWWAVIAGVGLVVARTVWTSGFWYLPYALFWLWGAAVSITLLAGGVRDLRAAASIRPAAG
jgi:hypothetical protein